MLRRRPVPSKVQSWMREPWENVAMKQRDAHESTQRRWILADLSPATQLFVLLVSAV